MRILALDSSGLTASAAILEDGALTAEYTVNFRMTHSQTLLPMIDEISRMTGLEARSLDAVAIAGGPGSFTGLRIGSATAKGIALSADIPVISVPTVDALAWNLYGAQGVVCPMMDARRGQVYTGLYRFRASESGRGQFRMETILPQCPLSAEELADRLNEIGEPVIVLGDGVPVFRELLREKLRVSWSEAPAHLNRQRAGAVASLAVSLLCGEPEDGLFRIRHPEYLTPARDHVPEYLRVSQAERERAQKNLS